MNFLISLFYLFLLSLTVNAQQSIEVTGELYKPNNTEQRFLISNVIRNPIDNSFTKVFCYNPQESLVFKGFFLSNSSKLYFLNYGGKATKIFLAPGDSIQVYYSKLDTPIKVITAVGYDIVTTKLSLSGNHFYEYNFFDSLETNTGLFIGNNINIDKSIIDWEKIYKDTITFIYNKRLRYLDYYNSKYYLRKEFINIAKLEIKSTYLKNLLEAIYFQGKNKFSNTYFAPFDSLKLTWSDYKLSNTYSAMVYVYVTHYLNWENLTNIGTGTINGSFGNIYEQIMQHITDDSIRNFHLTYLMSQYLEKHPWNYEEYFERYKKDCTNKQYINGIIRLHADFMAKYNEAFFNDSLLNTSIFFNTANDSVSLKDILKNHKPILIDFWASWCGPCIIEMPKTNIFASKYKNKVDFIYVSIDEKKQAWLTSLKNNSLPGTQYLLKEGMKSKLAKFLKLTYVPRFVLLDKYGRIKEFKAPESGSFISFQKMLDAIQN